MGIFANFGTWLTSSTQSGPKKAHPDLRPIDVAKLATELNLLGEAKRLGEAGVPAVDANIPSGPEAAAIQRVEKARQDYVDWAVLRLGLINQDIAKGDVTREVNRARQADQEFVRKASTILTEKDALLKALGDTAKNRTSELQSFKASNAIGREANYPSGIGVGLRWAFLVFLVVIEGLLNSAFFAQGLDTGLIGGASYAMSLAAFNIAVAYSVGRVAVRYANHRSMLPAVLGWFSVLFALAAMTTIGLGIAHFRDALTSESASPAAVALATLKTAPFQLNDVMSWALLGISMAFGIGALLDGLFMDDLYPGYGAATRRARQAVGDFEDELDSLREELEDLKDEELKLLDDTVQRSQASLRSCAAAVEDKKVTESRLLMAFRDADNALDALLHQFRTENQVYRRGVVRPRYFDQPTELKPIRLPDFDTAADSKALLQQQREVALLLAEVQDIRARIQAAFNQQFDRLKPLDIHFPGRGVS